MVSHYRDVTHDASNDTDTRYSIGELAEMGGVSRRTVRFYVQRGLLAPPHGVGRGAYYDAAHLARLLAVKHAQERGLPLDAIADQVGQAPLAMPRADAAPPIPLEPWTRLCLAPGVELHLRAGALSPAQLAALTRAITPVLTPAPAPDSSAARDPDASEEPLGPRGRGPFAPSPSTQGELE